MDPRYNAQTENNIYATYWAVTLVISCNKNINISTTITLYRYSYVSSNIIQVIKWNWEMVHEV